MKKILGFTGALFILGFAFPALALTISPARIEITGDPGTTISGEIELTNEQEGDRTFYTSTENFEPSGESGAPHFIGGDSGLATWVNTEESITIKSGEKKVIPFSIKIPSGTEPGGYFAAIFFGTQPTKQGSVGGGEVSVGAKIGALVLLRVSGYVPEAGGLLSFGAKDMQRFYTRTPVDFSYRLSNKGADRIVPQGNILIKNSLWITSADIDANKSHGSALPGSTRRFDATWDESLLETTPQTFWEKTVAELIDFHLGVYTARLSVAWGVEAHTEHASYVFFVLPWHALIIIFVGLAIILPLLRLGVKRYNAFIIAQAARSK